jgi:hypothetical protein
MRWRGAQRGGARRFVLRGGGGSRGDRCGGSAAEEAGRRRWKEVGQAGRGAGNWDERRRGNKGAAALLP